MSPDVRRCPAPSWWQESAISHKSLRSNFVANAPDMDIKTLQVLARHKDISTTMKHYVRAKEDAKRRAIEGVSLGRIIGEGS
jgi:hypothetical protein